MNQLLNIVILKYVPDMYSQKNIRGKYSPRIFSALGGQPPPLFLRLDLMAYRRRMIKNHLRTGKAHDLSDLFPHLRTIAVHPAVGAKGLCLHKRAVFTAGAGIVIQLPALRSQPARRIVILPAVEQDHLADHPLFPLPLYLHILTHWSFLRFMISMHAHPSATSSTIIRANPSAAPIVPRLECSPSWASGISSSITT